MAGTVDIHFEINSLSRLIDVRLHKLTNPSYPGGVSLGHLEGFGYGDYYGKLVLAAGLSGAERIVLMLALAPYIKPDLLDRLNARNVETDSNYTQIGGKISSNGTAFLPTGETALFLLDGGNDIEMRLSLQSIFDADQPLYRYNLLKLQAAEADEPPLSGRIVPTEECLQYISSGKEFKPTYNSNFPAQLLTTTLSWDDLVLPYDTLEALDELDAWLAHHNQLQQMPISRKFKRGYRALLHGSSGTGKTLTASLLGSKYNRDVYHIDLSMMVSKYIGETEKNLKQVFDIAENKGWILFFDEADALFGKRTTTQSSNDKYANQEVSYLLQRVEDYPGLIILASNLKANMDKAFLRRFQSIIFFPVPGVEERHLLWEKAFSEGLTLEEGIDLRQLAKTYEITGAAIGNILRYCTLMALKRDSNTILEEELLAGIRRELAKEGKML